MDQAKRVKSRMRSTMRLAPFLIALFSFTLLHAFMVIISIFYNFFLQCFERNEQVVCIDYSQQMEKEYIKYSTKLVLNKPWKLLLGLGIWFNQYEYLKFRGIIIAKINKKKKWPYKNIQVYALLFFALRVMMWSNVKTPIIFFIIILWLTIL